LNITKELLRQIEIAAHVLEKNYYYSENDLIEMMRVSPQTLRRDMSKLRSMGVDIHSSKKVIGIDKVDLKTLNDLICAYLSLNENVIIKNLKLLRKKFSDRESDKTLSIFVKILKSINNKKLIEFTYGFTEYGESKKRLVTPVTLINTGRSFHLIGLEDDDTSQIKIFVLEKISNIKFTKKRSKLKELPNPYFLYGSSWGYFTGGPKKHVHLKFSKQTGDYIKEKIWIEDQIIEEVDDGIIFKIKVNLSYEFISWVMGWGNEVEIIKPIELKNRVLERAKEIVKKYN